MHLEGALSQPDREEFIKETEKKYNTTSTDDTGK